MLTNEECVEFVRGGDHKDLGLLMAELIYLSIQKGSRDNCSAMLIQVGDSAVESHKEDDERHSSTLIDPEKLHGFQSGYMTSMLLLGSLPEGEQDHVQVVREKFNDFHRSFGFNETPTCSGCGNIYLGMQECACKNRLYCSELCQKADWNGGHKDDCTKKDS